MRCGTRPVRWCRRRTRYTPRRRGMRRSPRSVADRLERDPPVPAGRHAASIGVQVLPEEAGVVPARLEPGCDRRVLVAALLEFERAAVRRVVVVDLGRVGVVAGEDAGAAGAAQRVRDERVGKRHAVLDQERLHVRHRPQRVPALVVGQDHDHVRARGRRDLEPWRGGPPASRLEPGHGQGDHDQDQHRRHAPQSPAVSQPLAHGLVLSHHARGTQSRQTGLGPPGPGVNSGSTTPTG